MSLVKSQCFYAGWPYGVPAKGITSDQKVQVWINGDYYEQEFVIHH